MQKKGLEFLLIFCPSVLYSSTFPCVLTSMAMLWLRTLWGRWFSLPSSAYWRIKWTKFEWSPSSAEWLSAAATSSFPWSLWFRGQWQESASPGCGHFSSQDSSSELAQVKHLRVRFNLNKAIEYSTFLCQKESTPRRAPTFRKWQPWKSGQRTWRCSRCSRRSASSWDLPSKRPSLPSGRRLFLRTQLSSWTCTRLLGTFKKIIV